MSNNEMVNVLRSGFYTIETGEGHGHIKISFESLADLHAAHDVLLAILVVPVVERQEPVAWPEYNQ